MADVNDPKLLEAISFFEKLLQTMPDDRTGLEFLSVAYEQSGARDKQIATLIKLSETLLKEGDLDHAAMIAAKLKDFADVPSALSAAFVAEKIIAKGRSGTLQRGNELPTHELFIETGASAVAGVQLQEPQSGTVQSWSSEAAKAEMEVVWYWKDNGIVPKDACMDLLHILMDSPLTEIPTLISALGLLEEQHPEFTTQAFESMQKRSKLTPIPLEIFEVPLDVIAVLPLDYIKVKGVFPFSIISNEVLVGIMNGVNPNLRAEISKMTGMACHFYLIHPRAWFSASDALFGAKKTLG